jgi:hypothetical protein
MSRLPWKNDGSGAFIMPRVKAFNNFSASGGRIGEKNG